MYTYLMLSNDSLCYLFMPIYANCGGIIIKQRSRWQSLLKNENVDVNSPEVEEMILGSPKQDKLEKNNPDIDDVLPTPSSFDVEASAQPILSDVRVAPPSAVIGAKIRFVGELVGEEDLLIQGSVEGTVDLKGNTLTIGKQGVVKANVLAKTVTIEGQVNGDVFGEEKILVKSTSHVTGNLIAERVTLEDGAKFKGSIDMDMDSRKDDLLSFNQKSILRSSSHSPAGATKTALSSPKVKQPADTPKVTRPIDSL